MTWNYRILRHREGEHTWLALHEVFYDDGKPTSCTAEPIGFVADDDEGPVGIIGSLEYALADARRYALLEADSFGRAAADGDPESDKGEVS